MNVVICFLTIVSLTKDAGTTDTVDQYVQMTLKAYPDKAEEIKAAARELANPSLYPPDHTPGDHERYDFIVVGAGSAGSVVANRLTEIEGWKVLLIEAGQNPVKSMEVPSLEFSLINSDADWAYKTTPDGDSCLGLKDKSCVWPRGKVLGGTSAINCMLYDRGSKKDYDRWAEEGCTGWHYENVLNYFKKSEDMRSADVLAYSPDYHSTKGYLNVEDYQTFAHEGFYSKTRKAMKEIGYGSLPDCNGKNRTGYARMQGTLKDGRRCSAAKAFLSPIRSRSNLKVTKGSLATKIFFDGNKRAFAVEYIKNGTKKIAKANNEIVLSAGTINSPQLLMLSGIGPKEHLDSLKIKVIADLPVGKNLQDQPFFINLLFTTNYSETTFTTEESMYNFLMKKPSVFSHLSSIGNIGRVTLAHDPDWPDLEIGMFTFKKNTSENLKSFFGQVVGLRSDFQQQILDLNKNAYLSTANCCFMRSNGRGQIKLNSTNPYNHPIIITGYFTDDKDIDRMLKYFDFYERLINTDGMKSLDAKLYELKVPDCEEKYTFKSRHYRICALKHLAVTSFRIVGTCKMGASNDSTSVVDPFLRVKGVAGLRVIDASIMPRGISGNTNAPTIMIGEKGSDIIKDYWLSY